MTFDEYYKKYLTYHTKLGTRLLHVIGNLATVAYIGSIFFYGLSLGWLLLSPFVIYVFAWPSHWWIEGNKPAAFKNPIKAKMADWKMMFDMMKGTI
jgi:hypothetical protein